MNSTNTFEAPLAGPAGLRDWLKMPRHERSEMMAGPTIIIYIGDIAILNVARHVAVTLSKTLAAFFAEFPNDNSYRFEADLLDPRAVTTLLITWPQMTCGYSRAKQVRFQDHFHQDIAVLRAARFLGMEKYTNNILEAYIKYMKTQIPHYSEIAIVEDMRTSDKDPVWTSMVNHLCHLRHIGQIPDPEYFAEFLSQHPGLSATMVSVDQYFKAKAAERRRVLMDQNLENSPDATQSHEVKKEYSVWDREFGERMLTEKEVRVWRAWRDSRF